MELWFDDTAKSRRLTTLKSSRDFYGDDDADDSASFTSNGTASLVGGSVAVGGSTTDEDSVITVPNVLVASVSALLENEKPTSYCPRIISAEVDRIAREFQNQQVEVRLVQAVLSGRDYLRQTSDFTDVPTEELQNVVDIASTLRQRSLRNAKLFEAAAKVG